MRIILKKHHSLIISGALVTAFLTIASADAATATIVVSSTNGPISGPVGVAATPSELLFTQPFCNGTITRGVYYVSPTGNVSLYAAIPNSPVSNCVENYIAISPGLPGFPVGTAYVTSNQIIYQVTSGSATPFVTTGAALTASAGHSGIGFDPATGSLLFTSVDGVWSINSAHVATKIAAGVCGTCYIESPTVDAAGNIFVTVEDEAANGGRGPASGIYEVTSGGLTRVANMGGKAAPESIQIVPSNQSQQCGYTINNVTYGGFLSVFSQAIAGSINPTDSLIVGYSAADIAAQAGKSIVAFEYSPGLLNVADGSKQTLNTFGDDMEVMSGSSFTSFGNVPTQLEGFNIVTCPTSTATGCPATQGFWHKAANWPTASAIVDGIVYSGAPNYTMKIGGITYTQAELLQLMPSGSLHSGNYANSLSQLIAAVLNEAAGAQHTFSADAAILSDNVALTGTNIFCGANFDTLCSVSPSVVSTVESNLTALDNYNSAVGLNCTEGAGLSTGSGK